MKIKKTKVKDTPKIEPTPDNRIKKVCSICGKEFFGQGYGGHMWNRHNIKVGRKVELQQLKSKLEAALKLADHKDYISKADVVTCPKCKAASWARDWGIVTPGKVN